ncbi:hypothetical protein GCM10009530_13250 [Microbispora corallina]
MVPPVRRGCEWFPRFPRAPGPGAAPSPGATRRGAVYMRITATPPAGTVAAPVTGAPSSRLVPETPSTVAGRSP